MALNRNDNEAVKRAVSNNGHVDVFGLPSPRAQAINADYHRQKDAKNK